MIDKVSLAGGVVAFEFPFGLSVVSFGPVGRELRDGDGGQNTDNRDNNHQLDQRKTFLTFLTENIQYIIPPYNSILISTVLLHYSV
jgi:hypothetical protein